MTDVTTPVEFGPPADKWLRPTEEVHFFRAPSVVFDGHTFGKELLGDFLPYLEMAARARRGDALAAEVLTTFEVKILDAGGQPYWPPGGWVDAPERVPRADEATAVSIRLPKKLLGILEEFAQRRGIGYQALVKRWLDERVAQEREELRRARRPRDEGGADQSAEVRADAGG